MFNENSFTVQFYLRKIREDGMDFELVPNLFNLREVISEILNR